MRISDWSSDVCSSDLQLAAAVLVEEDDARIELARLREQEIERHGLSRTRRADDREIAEITLVKVAEIRPCRGRLEQGDRIAPMIALALAKCEIMPALQPSEIAFRNQSPPCDYFQIHRQTPQED